MLTQEYLSFFYPAGVIERDEIARHPDGEGCVKLPATMHLYYAIHLMEGRTAHTPHGENGKAIARAGKNQSFCKRCDNGWKSEIVDRADNTDTICNGNNLCRSTNRSY